MRWIPLLVLALAWGPVAVRRLLLRWRSDEAAVRSHREALALLSRVSGTDGGAASEVGPHLRLLTPDQPTPRPVAAATGHRRSASPAPRPPAAPAPAAPAPAAPAPAAPAPAGPAPIRPLPPARRRAPWRRLPWELPRQAVAAAAIGIALLASAVALGSQTDGTGSAAGASAATTTTTARSASRHQRAEPPRAPVLHPSSFDGRTARYQLAEVPAGEVVLTASAPCWVEVRDAPGGAVLWQATVAPAQQQAIPFDGSLWLRIGNPRAASVSIGGAAVDLPAGAAAGAPINLELTAAPPGGPVA